MINETFAINGKDLVRSVVPKRGDPYSHFCTRKTFVEVLHTIDELEGRRFVYQDIQSACDMPFTQVATAVAFLKERSCIITAHPRRHIAATDSVYCDGITEWAALAHLRRVI